MWTPPVTTLWLRFFCWLSGGHQWRLTENPPRDDQDDLMGCPIACERCGSTSKVGDPV